MYGLTRATTTLIAAGVAGLLIWIATQVNNDDLGGYWARIGLVAGAGLVMALSQLLGGWTKWGLPRLSIPVLLTAFVPVAFVSLWIILAGEPGNGWFHRHVLDWSGDIQIGGLVDDMLTFIPVLAFGTGLVFGFSFDTTGPRRDVIADERADVSTTRRRGLFRRRETVAPVAVDRRDSDEPLTAERETVSTDRTGDREVVTTRRTDEDR
jgi:hypothetical protein